MNVLKIHPKFGAHYAILIQGQRNYAADVVAITKGAVLYELESGAKLWIPRKALRVHSNGVMVRDWYKISEKEKKALESAVQTPID